MSISKASKIKQILEQNGSKLCSIEFFKADGSLRKMQVQLRSNKGIKGEAACEQAQKAAKARKYNNPDLINVMDVELRRSGAPEAACWRSFHADKIIRVKADKVEYNFD